MNDITAAHHAEPIRLWLLHEQELADWLAQAGDAQRAWVAANGFTAERHRVLLVPDASGAIGEVLFGLGVAQPVTPGAYWWHAAAAGERLPAGQYALASALPEQAVTHFVAGWHYGQYRFTRYRQSPASASPTLLLPPGVETHEVDSLRIALALARDLINTPANDLTPEALAQTALAVADSHAAQAQVWVGDELLERGFPAVHAVGRAASVPPRLVDFLWGDAGHPKLTLVGKGVCFDTGGLDLKPAAAMALMKKDMGGAALTLALAQLVMQAKLPVRLRVILPLVENAVAGSAFRPGDVLATRQGLSVEVGNTDAEGRLILADALALADEEQPDLLIDIATLTGAARVALGPQLPALFSTDDALARQVLACGVEQADPLWRLPLWEGYDDEFGSKVADINNVSPGGFAGAIIAALFLQRFVKRTRRWLHIDAYAWNPKERPGRSVGADPHTVRALYQFLRQRYEA